MDVDDQGNAIVGGMAGGQKFPLKNPLYGTFTDPWECRRLAMVAVGGERAGRQQFSSQQVRGDHAGLLDDFMRYCSAVRIE